MSEKAGIMALGPREAKARVAYDIVRRFHGEDAAKTAEAAFNDTFAKGGVPEDVAEVSLSGGVVLADALIKAGIVESKTEWRRLILDGAVRTDKDEKIDDPKFEPSAEVILKIGKRRFVKVTV